MHVSCEAHAIHATSPRWLPNYTCRLPNDTCNAKQCQADIIQGIIQVIRVIQTYMDARHEKGCGKPRTLAGA